MTFYGTIKHVSAMNLTDKQRSVLLNIAHKACGMTVKGRMARLQSVIYDRMKAVGIKSVDKYITLLRNNTAEVSNFTDALTINWTYFFRENQHCEFLIKNVDRSKYLKIWSAACSTGAEPYSIAVQFLASGFNFEILAVDISDTALEKAVKGIYFYENVQNVPDHILHKYFQRGLGKLEGYVRVKTEVKSRVTFLKYNLLSNTRPQGSFDIIFCRNVMMYFDDNDCERLLQKLHKSLNSGGYLIVGTSENIFGYDHKFKRIKGEQGIYTK